MDLCNISVIKSVMADAGITFRKDFGQNFLTNRIIPEDIADNCADTSERMILEIGPGIGCLTQELAMRYKRVVAVEIWRSKTDPNKFYIGDEVQTHRNPADFKDELAWIDENGLEEIVMHAQGGKLTYLTKGSSVLPHDISENLMELGKVDPKMWIDNNRPNTTPANLIAQNNHIELSVGSLINIEHADKDSIPEIKEAVQKQLDAYMKNLNAGIKKYSR